MYGWAGQRLKVYLTEGEIVKEPLSEELRLNYLGGRGLNSKTLFDELRPGIDPLRGEGLLMARQRWLPQDGRLLLSLRWLFPVDWVMVMAVETSPPG
ncbi:MAG: hypothetical protein HYY80_04400 [Chloroflexi bacterium]|nr:hypothetical protein [Chloroflexota bacterium]